MAAYIDEKKWWNALSQPDWYSLLADDFNRLEKLGELQGQEPNHKQIKGEAYAIVEKALSKKPHTAR